MSAEQLAFGSRLAEHRVAGFCYRLLETTELTLHVQLLDEDAVAAPATRGFNRIAADCYVRREDGFPPVVFYEVKIGISRGARVLAEAPIPVYVSRVTADGMAGSGCSDFVDDGIARHALLATVLQRDLAAFALPLDRVLALHLTSGAQFQAAVLRALREYEGLYWATVREAIESGVLRLDEAILLRPIITVTVEDCRSEDLPIPSLPEFEPTNPYR